MLVNTYEQDDHTMKFLNQLKDLFESYNICMSIVPIMIIGGPNPKWPLKINYTNETKDSIRDFLTCFQGILAKDKIINIPPPAETKLPKDYNISLIFFCAPYFNNEGGIYFEI